MIKSRDILYVSKLNLNMRSEAEIDRERERGGGEGQRSYYEKYLLREKACHFYFLLIRKMEVVNSSLSNVNLCARVVLSHITFLKYIAFPKKV